MTVLQGSDIEVRSNIGFTPLIYACQRGHLEMATLLAGWLVGAHTLLIGADTLPNTPV